MGPAVDPECLGQEQGRPSGYPQVRPTLLFMVKPPKSMRPSPPAPRPPDPLFTEGPRPAVPPQPVFGLPFEGFLSMLRFKSLPGQIWQVLILLIIFAFHSPAHAGDTPNIVFIFADDWGRMASAYAELAPGGPSDVVSTPNFDRVAKQGVLFRNAFVNAPSCTPCRSSLLSGQYFWRTGRGAILRGAVWDREIPTYPLLLQKAGYHIGFSYKVWSPGTPANAPYGGRPNAYHQGGTKFNGFSQFVSKAADPEKAKQQLLEEVRENFKSFKAAGQEGQPYCYWFGPTNCHRTWIQGSGKELWGIDPDSLRGKMPPFLPDVPVVREDVADYLGEVQALDAAIGVILEELQQSGDLENTVVIISGDHGMPGVPHGKCNLYDFGVQVPLAMMWLGHFPGDRIVDDFVNMTDLAPTLLELGGTSVPEVMTGRSLVPILESERAGQVDTTRDHVLVGRERHVESARPDFLPYPQRAIRTRDHLLIINFKPDRWPMGVAPGVGLPEGPWPPVEAWNSTTRVGFADMDASPTRTWLVQHRSDPEGQSFFDLAFGRRPEIELYDLTVDPHQINNIATQEPYAKIKHELHQRLLQELRETQDPRVTGTGETFDQPPFAGPLPKK